jgi:hypothetical protein
MVFFSLFFLFFCPPISLMDLATWRRSCHGIADRMVAPRPGPLASHRPQAQLVADASPPAIPWARLAHYWSACCFWNPPSPPPPITSIAIAPPKPGDASPPDQRRRRRRASHPPGTQPLPRSSFVPAVVHPFLPILSSQQLRRFVCLFVCLFYLPPPHHHKLTRLIHWSCNMQ